MKVQLPVIIALNPNAPNEDKYIGWVVTDIPTKLTKYSKNTVQLCIYESANNIEVLIEGLKDSINEIIHIFPELKQSLITSKFPDLWVIVKFVYYIALDFYEDECIAKQLYKQMVFTMIEVDL